MYKRDGRWKGVLLGDRDFSAKRFTTATNLIGQLFSGCPLFLLLVFEHIKTKRLALFKTMNSYRCYL
jgi:hypothetical protein